MKKYIGLVSLLAIAMTFEAFSKHQGSEMKDHVDGTAEGYLVKYENGFEFWVSKEEFEKSNKPCNRLTFGHAIEALKHGKRLAREGWNGNNMFIFMQVPAIINKDIVPKMQSLPDDVKAEFQKRFDNPSEQIDAIYYQNQIAMVSSSNVITGWSPSVSDALADDWTILD